MQAREVMTTPVVTVQPNAPLVRAITAMERHHLSGLPVVDSSGRLVGILTEGDLLRRVEIGTEGRIRPAWLTLLLGPAESEAAYVHTHSRRVDDIMTREVVTAAENADLKEIVALMERRHIKRVPIVSDGKLAGIISRFDLVRALGQALRKNATRRTSDTMIRRQLNTAMRDQNWLFVRDIGIAVANGEVTLTGTVSDEGMRAALCAMAESIAGVTKVRDRLTIADPAEEDLG